MTLYVEKCNKSSITFVVVRSLDGLPLISSPAMNRITNKFEFDFRYYNPYHGTSLKSSGVYVFKTEDTDSTPFDHSISSI